MNEKTLRDLIAEGEQIEAEQKKPLRSRRARPPIAQLPERWNVVARPLQPERAEQRCLDRYWDEVKP